MIQRNLVIAPCGNDSVYFRTHWLKDSKSKNFDLCLLFYHEEIKNPGLYSDADYFFHLKDFKYRMIHELLTTVKPELLEQYDYFYLIDDDIVFDTASINQMFLLSRTFQTSIAQASLSHNSYHSWPILKHQPGCVLRYLGQIEVMAPVFSRDALKTCLPTFIANKSSWGFDAVWAKVLGYPKDKIAIFDSVIMHHANPVGTGELYKKIGVDPFVEWKETIKMYDAVPENFVEYGRLIMLTKKDDRMYYLVKQFPERCRNFLVSIRRRGFVKSLRKMIKGN
jgi:hypothetical protein